MNRRAEPIVAALLGIAALCAIGFIVAYVATTSTQLMGLAIGAALLLIAAALIVAGRYIVSQETAVEERPSLEDPEAVAEVQEEVDQAEGDVTRRKLLLGAGTAAAGALAVAGLVPLASLGPETNQELGESPWQAGVRLVDERRQPILATAVVPGSFTTAFPEHADPRQIGAPLIVVGLKPEQVHLPADRHGWNVGGVVAYSKTCTHAGCAVGMLRSPLFAAHSPPPAMVCPCHYSSFNPATGGTVVFGPAGRPLPQLPLRTRTDGTLEAAGHLSGPVGPAWWSINA